MEPPSPSSTRPLSIYAWPSQLPRYAGPSSPPKRAAFFQTGNPRDPTAPVPYRRMLGWQSRFISCTSRSMFPRLLVSLFIFSTRTCPD